MDINFAFNWLFEKKCWENIIVLISIFKLSTLKWLWLRFAFRRRSSRKLISFQAILFYSRRQFAPIMVFNYSEIRLLVHLCWFIVKNCVLLGDWQCLLLDMICLTCVFNIDTFVLYIFHLLFCRCGVELIIDAACTIKY